MAYCPNCGASVEGRFCPNCGTAITGTTAAPGSTGSAYATAPEVRADMSENVAAALCYLIWLITGVVFLLLAPYNQNRLIRFHAFQSIFLGIVWMAIWIVVRSIPGFGFTFLFIWPVLSIAGFILWIFMLLKTYSGTKVVLPVIGPLAEKQANA